MKTFCPFCEKGVDAKLTRHKVTEFKKVKINTFEYIPICPQCNEALYISDVEEDNTKRIYKAYRDEVDLISASEIINLREKYNISQRELTGILGFGKMTINRYEKGDLPSKSQSDYLKLLIKDDSKFLNKVKESYSNKSISKKTYDKIINNETYKNIDPMIYEIDFRDNVISYLNAMLTRTPDIYNGYQSFNLSKTETIISYIASNVKNLTITSLNKYLWYIDMISFSTRAISITGLTYEKQKFGPTIYDKKYNELLLLDKYYERDDIETDNGYITKIISKNNYDINILNDNEKEIVDKVIKTLKNKTISSISELSHKEDGWSKTKLHDKVSYDYAMTIRGIKI